MMLSISFTRFGLRQNDRRHLVFGWMMMSKPQPPWLAKTERMGWWLRLISVREFHETGEPSGKLVVGFRRPESSLTIPNEEKEDART